VAVGQYNSVNVNRGLSSGGFRGGLKWAPLLGRLTDAVTHGTVYQIIMWQRYCIMATPSPVYRFKNV